MLDAKQLKNVYQNRWAGAACFLDNKSAKVCGRLNDVATIAQLNSALSVDFSWATIDRIMRKTKHFKLS